MDDHDFNDDGISQRQLSTTYSNNLLDHVPIITRLMQYIQMESNFD